METTPETEALLAELFERSAIVTELDGPQIEAWVSGLFPVFDTEVTAERFVAYCQTNPSDRSGLLCAALASIADGDVARVAAEATGTVDTSVSEVLAQINSSVATQAWKVEAPFGTSIVIGFETSAVTDAEIDLRHSILVELGKDGEIEDLQLAGAPQELLAEAAAEGDRVHVLGIEVDAAATAISEAWPRADRDEGSLGPGLLANQMFVRARLRDLLAQPLPIVEVASQTIDIQRGMSNGEYADANRAALSTLQSAVGVAPEPPSEPSALHDAWVEVIRGSAGALSARERDGLLWLEWADWLGAGIGLLRAGVGASMTGTALVDLVNRCPEVSSSVSAADRDYAEWAFEVAVDLLTDVGASADAALTQAGYESLHAALGAAWSPN